jgi:hypothetical protein
MVRKRIDLRYTHDRLSGPEAALAAIKIAKWMLLEQLKKTLLNRKEK